MMIFAGEEETLTITPAHLDLALDVLIEAEFYMGDIFKAMRLSGQQSAYEDTWYFVFQAYTKENRPIADYRIINFLKERVPVHSIMQIIDTMERGKSLISEIIAGIKHYKPGAKE